MLANMDFASSKLKPDCMVFCGHEYTLKNLEFCQKAEENNKDIEEAITKFKARVDQGLHTVPSFIRDELKHNVFMRCRNTDL